MDKRKKRVWEAEDEPLSAVSAFETQAISDDSARGHETGMAIPGARQVSDAKKWVDENEK